MLHNKQHEGVDRVLASAESQENVDSSSLCGSGQVI